MCSFTNSHVYCEICEYCVHGLHGLLTTVFMRKNGILNTAAAAAAETAAVLVVVVVGIGTMVEQW